MMYILLEQQANKFQTLVMCVLSLLWSAFIYNLINLILQFKPKNNTVLHKVKLGKG